jgi:hypothetical protein
VTLDTGGDKKTDGRAGRSRSLWREGCWGGFAPVTENQHGIKASLAEFRKRALLVGIPSSSEQNAEQCFPALCGGLNAGARF